MQYFTLPCELLMSKNSMSCKLWNCLHDRWTCTEICCMELSNCNGSISQYHISLLVVRGSFKQF